MRRFPLAFLLVGVMSLLAAGGAVLGVFQAPTGADLSVHNDVGETLLASRVVGEYTSTQLAGTVISFDFTAPDHVEEEALSSTGKVEERQRVSGAKAEGVLGPLQRLLSLHAFSIHGSSYDDTQTAREVASGGVVSEKDSTQVQLEGGYAVSVLETVELKEGSRHSTVTADYRLSRVGGWTRSS